MKMKHSSKQKIVPILGVYQLKYIYKHSHDLSDAKAKFLDMFSYPRVDHNDRLMS